MGLICLREEIKSGNNKSVFVMEAGLRESYRGCGGVRSPPRERDREIESEPGCLWLPGAGRWEDVATAQL